MQNPLTWDGFISLFQLWILFYFINFFCWCDGNKANKYAIVHILSLFNQLSAIGDEKGNANASGIKKRYPTPLIVTGNGDWH